MRLKFTLIFAAILLFAIAGIAAANNALLGRIYKNRKRSALVMAYSVINGLESYDTQEAQEELEKIYSTRDITILITDADGKTLFASSLNAEDMPPKISEHDDRKNDPSPSGENPQPKGSHNPDGNNSDTNSPPDKPSSSSSPSSPSPSPSSSSPSSSSSSRRADLPYGDTHSNMSDEGMDNAEYIITEETDKRLGTYFVQLSSRLQNGNLLYMQTPMATVDEAASIANTLLIYIGIAVMIIGAIVVAFATSTATKPIRELTSIAKDMSELNFTRRYAGKSRDEVGELGASINTLSKKLEETVSALQESNKKLEKDIELKNSIDKMRKEFIANASHELKTPVALISGYAEGLRDNIAANAEDKEFYCDVIIDEAKMMDKVIKQFLTMAEIESLDMSERENTSVNLSNIVENLVRSLNMLAKRQGCSMGLSCEKDIIVNGDEMSLTHAVNNYITNAIHHVDEKHIIEVSLKKAGERVRFSVYNSGKNIPEEGAEQIWESFGKLDKARTRSYGGSGLGLAIVKRSVELHGGIYGFNNTDEGVEFFFEI